MTRARGSVPGACLSFRCHHRSAEAPSAQPLKLRAGLPLHSEAPSQQISFKVLILTSLTDGL